MRCKGLWIGRSIGTRILWPRIIRYSYRRRLCLEDAEILAIGSQRHRVLEFSTAIGELRGWRRKAHAIPRFANTLSHCTPLQVASPQLHDSSRTTGRYGASLPPLRLRATSAAYLL